MAGGCSTSIFKITLYGINVTCEYLQNKLALDIETNNTLTEQERAEGWQLLFDGKTTNGWHKFNDGEINGGWIVENGELVALGKGGDIGGDVVSDKDFANFDLKLEWKISLGGNSGIFYHVKEGKEYKALYNTGTEYQLIDDVGFPQKLEEWQKAGANYAMHLADNSQKKYSEFDTLFAEDTTLPNESSNTESFKPPSESQRKGSRA